MGKSYGTIYYLPPSHVRAVDRFRETKRGVWVVHASHEIVIRIKRLFARAKDNDESDIRTLMADIDLSRHGVVILEDKPETCEDLRWILERYPMACPDLPRLLADAQGFRAHLDELDALLTGRIQPLSFDLAVPARPYQVLAADMWVRQTFLLLADQMGLGKTCSAIAALTRAQLRPALVVCPTHLPMQWRAEIHKFAPLMSVGILKDGKAVPDNEDDVTIVTYSKMAATQEGLLKHQFKSVCFDECQELRRTGSAKYAAAFRIARSVEYQIGLSGTPIYNYGDEIYNVIDCLRPGVLGTHTEFVREWCGAHNGKHYLIKDPVALGAYLRTNMVMLRRTRKDVDRQLPPSIDIVHELPDVHLDMSTRTSTTAEALARQILMGTFVEKGQAARELDMLLRQATGVAKAEAVAEFVRMLITEGEPVVLYGYHHAVYDIWRRKLDQFKPQFFTGLESPTQKREAVERFISGESKLLVISLRSGIGLDGLQHVSRTVVFGELDWSPQVMDQCKTRVDRDGQEHQVTCYYLVTETGSDPVVGGVLGLKRTQSEGVVDLGVNTSDAVKEADGARVKALAIDYLKRKGIPLPDTTVATPLTPAAAPTV